MANKIQIKRGTTTPTSANLSAAELGLKSNNKMYIGNYAGTGVEKLVMDNDFNAYSILKKDASGDAVALTVAEQTLVGRLSGGNITALTPSQIRSLLNVENGADVTDAANVEAAGAVMETDTSTINMQFVLDEDTMSSNSATKLATQQSIKAYVDTEVASAVTSEMSYKGGYDASTNTPNLDDTSPIAIAKGDTYTVTVAGTFFTTALEVGDVIIANKAGASTEADWTMVQKNMDAGSIKAAYESNDNTNAFTNAAKAKVDFITVTQAVNLDDIEAKANDAVLNSDTSTAAMQFVIDEDSFTSNLATKVPTQQSVKAYVDNQITSVEAQITAQDLDIAGNSGTSNIDLDSQVFSLLGGKGIESEVTAQTVTFAIDNTVVTLNDTQTLTNKTIDCGTW